MKAQPRIVQLERGELSLIGYHVHVPKQPDHHALALMQPRAILTHTLSKDDHFGRSLQQFRS